MMKTSPAASFVVAQSQFLLQFLIVPLDDPAMFGQVHQIRLERYRPVRWTASILWVRLPRRPFDQQPFFRMWLGSLIVAMRRTHADGGKTRVQFLFYPLPPCHLLPGSAGKATRELFDRNRLMSRHRAAAACGAAQCWFCVPGPLGLFARVSRLWRALHSHYIFHPQLRQSPFEIPFVSIASIGQHHALGMPRSQARRICSRAISGLV